jgi:hypothetical protein
MAVVLTDGLTSYSPELPDRRETVPDVSLQTHVFSVISWGCAATNWLAHVLNSHPDIYCVHASNHLWHGFAEAPLLDGISYLQLLQIEGRTCLAAGDVHGVSRFKIPEVKIAFGSKFSAAVLVREPLARLTSLLAMYEKDGHQMPYDAEFIDTLIDRHSLVLPDRSHQTKLFVHAVNMLNAIHDELEVGKIFRQEDITKRPERLSELVEEITAGIVSPKRQWSEEAIGTRTLNAHAVARKPFEPRGWQRDVVRKVVGPETWQAYADLGYRRPDFL